MTAARQGAADEDHQLVPPGDAVSLYERAPCGYLSTTLSGRITRANQTLLAWLGMPADAVVGRQLTDLLSAGGKIYYETHYAPLLAMQGSVREIAVDLVRRDDSRLPVLINATLVRDARGRSREVRVALFDATERRKYEHELLSAKESAETALVEAERARDQARAARERARALSQTLQQSLIPPATPEIPGLEIAAAYRPAGDGSEVGGDFYDVFSTRPDEWFLVLGDVCGKGVQAAVVTALARYTVRALAVSLDDPAQILHQLNETVLHHETERFCSVVLVRLRGRGADWSATVASGGHLPPLLLGPSTSTIETVEVDGHLIGLFPDLHFETRRVQLTPGTSLMLHTDGVTEARGPSGFYGRDRLVGLSAASAGDATELVDAVVEDVLGFQGGDARDDIAVLAVRVPD